MFALDDFADGIGTDFDRAADFADRVTVPSHPFDLLDLRRRCRLSAEMHPSCLRALDPHQLPLPADGVFKLREDAKELKEHRTHR